MTRPDGQESSEGLAYRAPTVREVEAHLVRKIRDKGLIHLTLEEVAMAYKSKTFADEWRATGSAMPDTLRAQMAERLNQCGRLRDDTVTFMVEREAAGPAFLKAVAGGEAEVVNRWLESKDRRRLMGPQNIDDQQRGCLHLAAKAGHLEVLRLLHDHGADLEARDRFRRTPLHLACEYGRRQAAEALLGYDCQAGAEDASRRTALHLAAVCEEPQIARLLALRHPTLVGKADEHGRTPLFYSVLNAHPQAMTDITRQLLELQAEPNMRDGKGMTALHYAAEEGKKAAVALLLRHRADPTVQDTANGHAPIELAQRHEGVRRELQKAIDSHVGAAPISQRSVAAGNGRGASPSRNPMLPAVAGPGRQTGISGSAWVGQPPIQGLRAPLALGTPFQVLQERFVKIMERVQEGGIEQMEHIKRPHLFTGSWMIDISTHQQLLGQSLQHIPASEVCIRVFNLLRPPATFPVSQGDEKEIIAIFNGLQPTQQQHGGSTRPPWGGPDPYAAAHQSAEDLDDLSQARRVELLRTIHDQKKDLDAINLREEELRRKVEGLQADVRERGEPGELQALRDTAERAKKQLAIQTEAHEVLEGSLSTLQGKNRVLQEQLAGEKQRSAELLADQVSVRSQLQALMSRRGEDQAWKQMLEDTQHQAEVVQRRLEDQLRETQTGKFASEDAETKLRGQVLSLQGELAQCTANTTAEQDANGLRTEIGNLKAEVTRLSRDLGQVQTQAARDTQEARGEVLEQMRLRDAADREAGQLRVDAAQLPKLASERAKLEKDLKSQDEYWKTMFREYHLIGQAFFGGPGPSEAPPADVSVAAAKADLQMGIPTKADESAMASMALGLTPSLLAGDLPLLAPSSALPPSLKSGGNMLPPASLLPPEGLGSNPSGYMLPPGSGYAMPPSGGAVPSLKGFPSLPPGNPLPPAAAEGNASGYVMPPAGSGPSPPAPDGSPKKSPRGKRPQPPPPGGSVEPPPPPGGYVAPPPPPGGDSVKKPGGPLPPTIATPGAASGYVLPPSGSPPPPPPGAGIDALLGGKGGGLNAILGPPGKGGFPSLPSGDPGAGINALLGGPSSKPLLPPGGPGTLPAPPSGAPGKALAPLSTKLPKPPPPPG